MVLEQSLQTVKPVFDVLGNSLVHIGDVGTGQITKAANQVIVGLNIGAVAEALTLAQRAGGGYCQGSGSVNGRVCRIKNSGSTRAKND